MPASQVDQKNLTLSDLPRKRRIKVIKAYTECLTCLYTLGEDLDSKLTSCDVSRKKELIDVPGVVLGELLRWVRD